MTYLQQSTCLLLQKLGIECETGMYYILVNHGDYYELSDMPIVADWVKDGNIPAYSLPLILTSSEAMRKVFYEEPVKVFVCPKCGYYKSYSKHDDALFCPNDGRKLKEGTKERSFYETIAYSKARDLIELMWSNQPEEAERVLVEALEKRLEEL